LGRYGRGGRSEDGLLVSHRPMGRAHVYLIPRSEVLALVTNLDTRGSLEKLMAIRVVLYLRSVVADVDVVVFFFQSTY